MSILIQLFLMEINNDIGKIVKVNIENSNQNSFLEKLKTKMKAA